MRLPLLSLCVLLAGPVRAADFSFGVCGAEDPRLSRPCRAAGGNAVAARWPAREEGWQDWWELVRSAAGRSPWVRAELDAGGPPSHSRLRFAAYLTLLAGGRGLLLEAGPAEIQLPERALPLAALARELEYLEPILREGSPASLPFARGEGIEGLALLYRGRDYVLILNRERKPVLWPTALNERAWRALFEERRDPLELLERDGQRRLLPPGRVLVLEKKRGPWL